MQGKVRIKSVEAVFCSYPQSGRGAFSCSDSVLSRIWEVGAHTLRCCAEDTYTDCPSYEQVHWAGDARNEALIDWVLNGDPRLWRRCLLQTGESLERSPITESHTPSAWVNIIPAWSALWMISCWEYLLFTGDTEASEKLLSRVDRNIAGLKAHLNRAGLFEINAWNMFDWAEMDTPPDAVVTHQNCFIVFALRKSALMAEQLGHLSFANAWNCLADHLAEAINAKLWNDSKGAFTDCLRGDQQSKMFSQQTQTVAYMSGVATGERAERCRKIISHPPDGFVRAGSPFFEFFLLEILQQENQTEEFIETVKKDWGFMVEMGAGTFWEMWSCRNGGRLTRSHCHAWSAAPTFFLSSYILGVKPGGPGFNPVLVAPHPGNLRWCRGRVPTPLGDIELQWESEKNELFKMRINVHPALNLDIRPPRECECVINGEVKILHPVTGHA